MKIISFEKTNEKIVTSRNIIMMIAATVIAGLIFIVPASRMAFAENNDSGNKEVSTKSAHTDVMLKINKSGNVELDGIRVTSIAGSVISGTVSWPAGIMAWTIVTDTRTNFLGNSDVRTGLAGIAVGDTIAIRGSLSATTPFSVYAGSVRELKEKEIN